MGKMVKMQIADAVWTEDKIWFAANRFNGLFCMDKETQKILWKGLFPNERYSQDNMFLNLVLIREKIYCIPYYAKAIAVYNIKEDKFESIQLDKDKMQCREGGGLFAGVKRCGDYLFMFPAFSKAIVRLDTNTQELLYITDWTEQIEKNGYNENEFYFLKQCVVNDNKMYVPFCNAEVILELDYNSLKSKIHKVGSEKTGYSGIAYDGKDFWMSAREFGDLIRWNLETNELERISLYQRKSKNVCRDYIGLTCVDGKVTVFPTLGSEDREDKKVQNAVIKDGQYLFVKETQESIAFCERNMCELTIIDKKTGYTFTAGLRIAEEIVDINQIFNENPFILEMPEISLHRMLMGIKSDDNECLTVKMDCNIGESVYKMIQ